MKVPGVMGARMALQSTAGATLRAPVTATKAGSIVLYERVTTLVGGHSPLTRMRMSKDAATLPKPGTEAFEKLLDHEGLPPRSSGRVTFFVDGRSFYPVFNRAIDEARQHLDVQAYIFDNDQFGVSVADHLKRKSADVPVRVYFDTLGTLLAVKVEPPVPPPAGFNSPSNMKAYLREGSKVEVRASSNPYYVADHTKLHLIDDTAFVGGMNVGVEYRYTWHDLMARIDGPVVQQLAAVYHRHWQGEDWSRNWGLRGWWDREKSPPAKPTSAATAGQIPLRMLLTDTPLAKREILRAALAGIRCARQRIWIETPYFSCDEVTDELKKAVARGVDVRIVIPGHNDSKTMAKANVAELKKLLLTGARVYEYPGMTHLKATICDGWAMFGSANYDTLSMRINSELNLAFSDPATVQELASKVFHPDFRKSDSLTIAECKARGGVFAEVMGDQL